MILDEKAGACLRLYVIDVSAQLADEETDKHLRDLEFVHEEAFGQRSSHYCSGCWLNQVHMVVMMVNDR